MTSKFAPVACRIKSVLLLAIVVFTYSQAYSASPSFSSFDKADLEGRIANLNMLLKSIDNLSQEIEVLQKTLQSQDGIGREQDLRTQINALSVKREELEVSFLQISTDVDTRKAQDEKRPGLDWNQEIKELLGPMIREMKKLTSRPREIEKLRNQIDNYQTQLPQVEKALKNIEILLTHVKDKYLIKKLKKSRQFWQGRQNEIQTRMSIATRQLEQKVGQKKSFSESAREITQIFFKSRGRNLIISFIAFMLTLGFFLILHKWISRFSPLHKDERSIYSRFFDVIYYSISVIVSILALLAVFYFFADWVLLSIAAIFLIGIGWASKQAVPIVWQQVKLMLNLGPVREGEVLVYNNLPYKVVSLNLYTRLSNELLEGGNIRLPIKDLLDLRSRPEADKEPWFPTRKGDWVTLSDGTHGKVIVQTPETVRMTLLGGASVTYRTGDFLSLSPMNLSKGFRLWITFGLDYDLQREIITNIPKILEEALNAKLSEAGHGHCITSIKVHFKSAGSSSLDLEAMADFNGQAGPDFDILKRIIAGICVDTCNKNNWKIPFHQLSVHMVNPSKKVES